MIRVPSQSIRTDPVTTTVVPPPPPPSPMLDIQSDAELLEKIVVMEHHVSKEQTPHRPMTASIRRFMDMLSSPSTSSEHKNGEEQDILEIQVPLQIDAIECQLILRRHPPPPSSETNECEDNHDRKESCVYEFCITTRTPLRNAGEFICCSDVEELMQELQEWTCAKYVGRLRNVRAYASFMKRKDACNYDLTRRAMHAMMYSMEPTVLHECYVCYEDTFGHKTVCGHDICPKCFYRSLKDLDADEESEEFELEAQEDMMFCPRVKFECGLCRTVEKSYL